MPNPWEGSSNSTLRKISKKHGFCSAGEMGGLPHRTECLGRCCRNRQGEETTNTFRRRLEQPEGWHRTPLTSREGPPANMTNGVYFRASQNQRRMTFVSPWMQTVRSSRTCHSCASARECFGQPHPTTLLRPSVDRCLHWPELPQSPRPIRQSPQSSRAVKILQHFNSSQITEFCKILLFD